MIPVGEGSSCADPSSVKKSNRFEIKKSGMSWLSGLEILLWITVLYAGTISWIFALGAHDILVLLVSRTLS